MKKLLLLSAFFVCGFGFGQNILVKIYEYGNPLSMQKSKHSKPKLVAIDTININEFKDEFISVVGENYHYLSTTNYKDIELHGSLKC